MARVDDVVIDLGKEGVEIFGLILMLNESETGCISVIGLCTCFNRN